MINKISIKINMKLRHVSNICAIFNHGLNKTNIALQIKLIRDLNGKSMFNKIFIKK